MQEIMFAYRRGSYTNVFQKTKDKDECFYILINKILQLTS
jgi:hypothetical protein